MTTATTVRYLSVSEIAARLDVPRHRVKWVIASRRIANAVQVGDYLGYDEEAAARIQTTIAEIDKTR